MLFKHVLPDVLHVVLSGTHVRGAPSVGALHLPPQQLESELHAMLSEMHCVLPQWPVPSQTNVQHSFPVEQRSPATLQRGTAQT